MIRKGKEASKPRAYVGMFTCLLLLSTTATLTFAQVPETLPLEEDWETGQGLWSADGGVWQVGQPTLATGPAAHGGTRCAGTDLAAPYPRNTDTRLVSPRILLQREAPGDSIVLEVWHWFDISTLTNFGGDYGEIEIRVNGGGWQTISDQINGRSDWTRFAADLTAYVDSIVEIAFHFVSDASTDGLPGWYIDDIKITSRSVVYQNPATFENGIGSWHADRGVWQVGVPTYASGPVAHGGTQCAGTDLANQYPRSADSRLISPRILLDREAPGDSIVLEVWHWFDISTLTNFGGDYGEIEIGVNGGGWQTISDQINGRSDWTRFAADLTAYADSIVEIAFHFVSDASTDGLPGWYIDDIKITSRPVVYQNPATFENGIGSWYANRGVWQIGEPTFATGPAAHRGSMCAGTDLAAPYPRNADTRLVGPRILLQRNSLDDPILLKVWHWFDISTLTNFGGDYGEIEIRVNGGPWRTVSGQINGRSDWTQFTTDLSAYADSIVEVAFHFVSDASTDGLPGWYIDDVTIQGIGGPFKTSISFPVRATAGDVVTSPLVLYNFGSLPLPINGFLATTETFSLTPAFTDSLAQGLVFVPPRSSLETQLVFSPQSEGTYSDTLKFWRNDTADTVAVVSVGGSARDLSYQVLLDGLYPDREMDEGAELTIPVALDDSVEVDSLLVFYTEGGSRQLQSVKMTLIQDDPVNDSYLGQVPGRAAGVRGLEVYVSAYNGEKSVPSMPEVFRVWVNDVPFDKALPAGKFRLISFPVELPNNTITGVIGDELGARDKTQWRLFAHTPESANQGGAKYSELPNDTIADFKHGQGYWIISRKSKTLHTSPQRGLSASTKTPFQITLQQNWNLIGNPFHFDVDWDSFLVDTMTTAQAFTNNLVSLPVEYQPGSGYEPNVKLLKKFEGYWIRNTSGRELTLSIKPIEAVTAVSDAPLVLTDESASWRLQISAITDVVEDRYNLVGVRPDANNQFDRFDHPKPPASPGYGLSVYFPHFDWGPASGNFAADVRCNAGSLDRTLISNTGVDVPSWGYVWHFDVMKKFSVESAGDRVTLEFSGFEQLPPDAAVNLLDHELSRVVDLVEQNVYTFFLGVRSYVQNESDTRFMILVGSQSFVESNRQKYLQLPLRTVLKPNYPNPFNPSTIIRYELAGAGNVELKVYDVSGALVKTLESTYRVPGRYEVGWDGDNDAGQNVSSGIYFYRLATPWTTQTRKMTLIK